MPPDEPDPPDDEEDDDEPPPEDEDDEDEPSPVQFTRERLPATSNRARNDERMINLHGCRATMPETRGALKRRWRGLLRERSGATRRAMDHSPAAWGRERVDGEPQRAGHPRLDEAP